MMPNVKKCLGEETLIFLGVRHTAREEDKWVVNY